MKDNLSKRDWETISAYLDGQLSGRKLTRFESRLEQDSQLQVALDEIRNTQHVLRNTPRLRTSRSFMLTPEMAGQPHRMPRLAPVFGWASAVASFLLVLFLVGDLFSTGGAIPMALNNIPTQDEFVAPSELVAEDQVLAQPAANTSKIDEFSAGSAEVAAHPEAPEGDTVPEVAAAPEIVSAPKEGPTATSEAIDEVAVEESTPSDTEVTTDELVEEVDTSVTFSSDPEVTEGEKETAKPDPDLDIQVEVASITETLEIEGQREIPLLDPPVVETHPEEEVQLPTEEPTQPSVAKVLPTDEVPAPQQSPTDEMPAIPQPSLTDELTNTEISTTSALETPLKGSAPAAEKQGGLLVGGEVILGLAALGAGLAWFYLRRRGG